MVIPLIIQQVIAESEALSATLAYVEGKRKNPKAALVETILHNHEVKNLEDLVVQFAMERVAGFTHRGIPALPIIPIAHSYEQHLFKTVALAWIQWTTNTRLNQAQEDLRRLRVNGIENHFTQRSSSLHLMALHPWQFAVEALIDGNRKETKRFFKRSMRLGGQCGTESNFAIQWTYAATFFYQP